MAGGCILLLVVAVVAASVRGETDQVFNIGAVLSVGEKISHFMQAIVDVNEDMNTLPPRVKLEGVSLPMDRNPIRTAQNVCNHLISAQVYAVIISHPTAGELSPAAVSYTCGFYNIPVIGISSRDSSLSDKNLHTSFMRTIPPYSNQADVWIEILKFLNYKCVTFIHSSDNDGRSTLGRFQNLADQPGIKVEDIIEYETGITEISQKLEEAQGRYCRVFILYASTEDAESIFREVEALNMTTPGYVWIVSEQALLAPNKPDGVIGLKLVNATDEEAHIKDSVMVIARGFRTLYYNSSFNIQPAPNDCSKHDPVWETGQRFIGFLKEVTLQQGKTGRVAFDDKGDRIDSDYDIINIVNGKPNTVGEYVYSQMKTEMTLSLNVQDIQWPGNEFKKPRGYIVPTHLKVVTVAEKPFTWIREVEDRSMCNEDEIPCPRMNRTSGEQDMYCCRGYCMDLLNALATELNFTYSLYQVEDGLYGSFDYVNGSEKKMWTGMVGDLVYERADMVVAPLTINPERSQAIEFSKPFKYQGITILEKKHPKSSTLASFLQPFQKTLWILVMVSVHVVALALYLLDRFSPFGRYKLPSSDATEEDALNLSSAIWFAWGVLLNSGIGEGTPRSFSARVLGMVWAGFAMIVVASYTANLAAFLVLDRPETSLTGINDARLRNPMDNFKYATVKGSSVDMYFRRQVELSNMYRTMEGKNYDSAEEAIAAVKSDGLSAFIWDSSRLEYEAAQDCNLVTAGEQFGRSGYGIGLQKHSLWADQVTLALLGMHESGYMEELDNRWILQGSETCEKNEKFPATLGLKNMAGVFILVGAGIVGGVGLIIIEIIYKKHQTRKQRRLELARHAADKWRGAVEKSPLGTAPKSHSLFSKIMNKEEKKTLRATLQAQKRLRANGMEAYTIEKGMQGLMSQTSPSSRRPPLPPRGLRIAEMSQPMELEAIRAPDIDTDIHHLPPPPPPPASSPAVRMRGGRVSYTPRSEHLFGGDRDRFDIPV
ncbi:glutamate [NMDA] receptor subunit 1-like isoform X2 [Argiope bruennichi]|uniref:glutamate [NMDA] receptor subunit 1-like isoform X2 n=1 Tax=Argiope bruennichi TaxID=94029 RepID=UPI0024958A30|nr:glutamate [NMDA] receptor subunit 1-like isoform X2 [Argiope bruennichi]